MRMVEKVARGLWEAEGVAYGWNEHDRKYSWDEAVKLDLYGVGPFRIFARAAIEAMREPTEEMIDAGVEAKMKLYERLEAEGKNTRIIVVANHPAGTIYEAMIDKAIQESGE